MQALPGAALVFLLAGPATKTATIAVVARVLGKKSAILYLASIIVVAILFGLGADAIYRGLGLNPSDWLTRTAEHDHSFLNMASGALLFILLVRMCLQKVSLAGGFRFYVIKF
ncbi:hypothetical protein [Desulfoplanes sp.]